MLPHLRDYRHFSVIRKRKIKAMFWDKFKKLRNLPKPGRFPGLERLLPLPLWEHTGISWGWKIVIRIYVCST